MYTVFYEDTALKRTLADVGVPCMATLIMRQRGSMKVAVTSMGGEGHKKQLEVSVDPEDTGNVLMRRLRYFWPNEVRSREPWLIALPSGDPLPLDATLKDSGVHQGIQLQLRHFGGLQIKARVGEEKVSESTEDMRGH